MGKAVSLKFGRQQPRRVFAEKETDRSDSCRPYATAARFGVHGQGERWMRREAAPHDLTRQAELIQQFRCVTRDPFRENVLFPRGCGYFVSLQLLQNVKRPIGSVKLCSARDVLPGKQVPHEIGAA